MIKAKNKLQIVLKIEKYIKVYRIKFVSVNNSILKI